jgi:hypothetical protein
MDPRGGGGIKHQVHRFRTHIPTDFTRGVPGKSTTNCTCIVRKIRFSVPPYWRRKDSIFVVASETKNPATGAGKVGSCFLPEGGRGLRSADAAAREEEEERRGVARQRRRRDGRIWIGGGVLGAAGGGGRRDPRVCLLTIIRESL